MKISLLIILLFGISLFLAACSSTLQSTDDVVLADFEECVAIGGTIAESYPRQCFYENQSFTEELSVDEMTPALHCLAENGVWIPEAQECEGMSQAACEAAGGNFNSCASACRNDPDALVCTKQCVFVCEFTMTQDDFQIPPGCTSWSDGCNTCVVENKEATACTEIYCEPTSYTKPTCLSFENSTFPSQEELADIPLNCKTWFDGCNVCFISGGELAACTRKSCPPEAMEEPECREYLE